ncbi:hypothetical protein EV361DRAFT_932863 [Lentinula raphanica]|nr:hypothetical protein F5880DRAFT_1048713 [Lentinula raphanica]KAJ3966981.1 hypothetical protein EV361DRAFT_932863 [Lentinula raphanica]
MLFASTDNNVIVREEDYICAFREFSDMEGVHALAAHPYKKFLFTPIEDPNTLPPTVSADNSSTQIFRLVTTDPDGSVSGERLVYCQEYSEPVSDLGSIFESNVVASGTMLQDSCHQEETNPSSTMSEVDPADVELFETLLAQASSVGIPEPTPDLSWMNTIDTSASGEVSSELPNGADVEQLQEWLLRNNIKCDPSSFNGMQETEFNIGDFSVSQAFF